VFIVATSLFPSYLLLFVAEDIYRQLEGRFFAAFLFSKNRFLVANDVFCVSSYHGRREKRKKNSRTGRDTPQLYVITSFCSITKNAIGANLPKIARHREHGFCYSSRFYAKIDAKAVKKQVFSIYGGWAAGYAVRLLNGSVVALEEPECDVPHNPSTTITAKPRASQPTDL
jgi:hypothetical protein